MKIVETPIEKNNEYLRKLLEKNSLEKNPSIPPYDKKYISLSAFSDDSIFIGGITGEICWNHLHISLLAVDSTLQNSGVGSKLLKSIEKIAKENSCHLIIVETMNWQAPEFYKKHGFSIFGEVKNLPIADSCKYYLVKYI